VKKFMNGVESMLTESLTGFAKAHHDIVVLDQEFRFVRRRRAKTGGRVALISGGAAATNLCTAVRRQRDAGCRLPGKHVYLADA